MIIIGNWKSHHSLENTRVFFEEFGEFLFNNPQEDKEIIICPSYISLKYASDFVHANDLKVSIGAQNISQHEEGAFTGEIAATQLKDIATHVIIGHSERRRFYGEKEAVVSDKVSLAKKAGLKVILCLQNENEQVESVDYIAYEPPSAIGSGTPDDPENIKKVLGVIKERNNQAKLLYGGSINDENIEAYTKIPNLEGFLVGGASLNSTTFSSLIKKC